MVCTKSQKLERNSPVFVAKIYQFGIRCVNPVEVCCQILFWLGFGDQTPTVSSHKSFMIAIIPILKNFTILEFPIYKYYLLT